MQKLKKMMVVSFLDIYEQLCRLQQTNREYGDIQQHGATGSIQYTACKTS